MSTTPRLLKAGQVAKQSGVLVSTIRFYTQTGILPSVARSPGGYYLYDPQHTFSILNRVFELKSRRLTLEEIKTALNT